MTAKELLSQAQQYHVCSKLSGQETAEELMDLVFTPQGIEFCTKHNFPSLAVLRTFKGPEAEKRNIYIDSSVQLNNAEQVLLVGETEAMLTYDDPSKRHQVILMHGAKAHIKASGYAVVFVTNSGGEVITEAQDMAKIL